MAKNMPPKWPSAGPATVPLPSGKASARGHQPVSPVGGAMPSEADITRLLQLGGAHLAAGRLDHAGAAAGAVLRVQPKNPDALHLLGLVAMGKGDRAQAEKIISAAAALMPGHANVWVNLGNAQRDQGKGDEALLSYLRAEAINADYPDLLTNRGRLYQETGQYSEALDDFERLMELEPQHPAHYIRAAQVAVSAGMFRDALSYAKEGLAQFDAPPPGLMNIIALTHERLGELDEAIEWAEKALARDPSNCDALCVWSKARRRKDKRNPLLLAELRQRLEGLERKKISHAAARLLTSELGQLCDEAGDYAAAFRYYTEMNEHTLALPELDLVDKQKFLREVKELEALFAGGFEKSWQPLPDPVATDGALNGPVFLVGFPRSGTTLLDQILDAHPQVQVFEELPFIANLKKKIQGYPETLATMTKEMREALRQDYREALRSEGADLNGKVIIDKMPLNLVHCGLITRVFPDAKFVFALRHPADCVLSCFMQDFVPNASMVNFLTLDGAATFYDRVMTLWQTCQQKLPLNVQEVRYENLIMDLRGEVEPVLAFLGLPWHEAVEDPAAHALARGTIRTPSYSQVTQPIYSSSSERWRRYQQEMEPVLPALAPHVKSFGYSL